MVMFCGGIGVQINVRKDIVCCVYVCVRVCVCVCVCI